MTKASVHDGILSFYHWRSQAKAMGWQPACRVLHLAECVSKWSACEVLRTFLLGGYIAHPPKIITSLSSVLQKPRQTARSLSRVQLKAAAASTGSFLCVDEPFRVKELPASLGSARRLVRGWGTSEMCFISSIADIMTSQSDLEAECIGLAFRSHLAPSGSSTRMAFTTSLRCAVWENY